MFLYLLLVIHIHHSHHDFLLSPFSYLFFSTSFSLRPMSVSISSSGLGYNGAYYRRSQAPEPFISPTAARVMKQQAGSLLPPCRHSAASSTRRGRAGPTLVLVYLVLIVLLGVQPSRSRCWLYTCLACRSSSVPCLCRLVFCFVSWCFTVSPSLLVKHDHPRFSSSFIPLSFLAVVKTPVFVFNFLTRSY